MATPTWQPSTFYAPGSLVQPATAQPAVPTPIPNWSFESGNVEWTLDSGLSIVNGADHYGPGTWSLQGNPGFTGDRYAEMQDFIDCTPGESITAKCQVQQGASSAGLASGSVYLRFYDAAHILIQENEGNIVNSGSGGAWHTSTVTATAPANTAFVRLATRINRIGENDPLWVDAFEWNKISQAQTGLIFKAVQANVGLSDATEPTWPLVNGQTVVDNTVTWEAVLATRIVWQAKPILVSGATEPAFTPTEGSTVGDNTISWRAVSRRVTDPNCPNSKIVIIGASKVFAADDDIVAYSATVNPLDWSTANNAGYIPSNLQQYGANPVAGLGLYRSNLWVGNSQGSQVWQIDEDPQQMALLDAFPVGTDYHDAVSPAFNDLFFLPSLGVRTLGIAGGSTNLQSGDAGMPIDTMVQESLTQAKVNGDNIQALYYPAAGQYWLMLSPPSVPTAPITLSGSFAGGTQSTAYTGGPLSVANGFPPYRWEIASGALPAGLEINQFTGIVSGTPSATGTSNFDVRVTDKYGRTDTHPCSIQVVFSANLIVYDGALRILSGATSAYTQIQSIVHSGTPLSISTTHDGGYMMTCSTGSNVRMFKAAGGGTYSEVTTPLSPAATGGVNTGCLSRDGAYLAISQGNNTVVYKKNAGDSWTSIQTLTNTQPRFGMKFSPDGNYLATCGNQAGQYLRVYQRSGDTFTLISSGGPNDGNAVAWSEDSAILCYSGRLVNPQMFSVSGATVTSLAIASVAVSGTTYAVCNADASVLFTRANAGATPFAIYQRSGAVLNLLANPVPAPSITSSAPFDMTADGRVLAIYGGTGLVRIYSVSGGVLTQIGTVPVAANLSNSVHYVNSADYAQ